VESEGAQGRRISEMAAKGGRDFVTLTLTIASLGPLLSRPQNSLIINKPGASAASGSANGSSSPADGLESGRGAADASCPASPREWRGARGKGRAAGAGEVPGRRRGGDGEVPGRCLASRTVPGGRLTEALVSRATGALTGEPRARTLGFRISRAFNRRPIGRWSPARATHAHGPGAEWLLTSEGMRAAALIPQYVLH
jgi:hypothetical protein